MNDFSKPQPAPPATERTQWGYKNHEGHRLHIMADRIVTGHVLITITGVGDLEPRGMDIPDAEVPGIALAMLQSAGFQAKGGPPEPETWIEAVEFATGQLDDAVFIQNRENKATERKLAEAELTRRRDELIVDLMRQAGFAVSVARHELAAPVAQAAIDMIISLQDEAAK